MVRVSDKHIEKMKENGMFVSDPFTSTHKVFPDGLHITKPTEEELLDYFKAGLDVMPGRTFLRLWFFDGKWIVECREFVPTPGPGDFVAYFDTEEKAVYDVLKFFSGDERWQFKQDLYNRQKGPVARDLSQPPPTVL